MAASTGGSLQFWNLSPRPSSTGLRVLTSELGQVLNVTFLPDHSRVLMVRNRGSAVIYKMEATGAPTILHEFKLPSGSKDWQAVAVSPNSRYLALATTESLYLFDLELQELISEVGADSIKTLAFRGDSRALVAGTSQGSVRLYPAPVDLHRPSELAVGPRGCGVTSVDFCPNGRYVAATLTDGSLVVLRVPRVGDYPHQRDREISVQPLSARPRD